MQGNAADRASDRSGKLPISSVITSGEWGKTALSTTVANYIASDSDTQSLFRNEFDRKPFRFQHTLHHFPIFSMDAMAELAVRLSSKHGRCYFDLGDAKAKDGWSAGATSVTAKDVLAGIANNRALVILKRVHLEPEYKPVLESFEAELSEMFGINIGSRYRDGLMTLLVASPGRVTPYHVDGEANLLMQIQGTKSVYIFDGNNREILPTHELEGFWAGDINATRYKEDMQDRAWEYQIGPGDGVTNPVTFPHWVKTGSEVSIALSVNFKRVTDDVADAYKVNKQLRKLGLNPTQPGRAKTIDHLKGMAYRTAKLARRSLKAKSKS
jgi:hypothetical protein